MSLSAPDAVPADNAAAATPVSGCDPQLRPLIERLVESGQVYVALLDSEHRIAWANGSFLAFIPGARLGERFDACLEPGAAESFRKNIVRLGDDSLDLELHHPAAGGVRVVTYRFVRDAAGRLAALGIDRSQEMEMVSQMAVLLEEIETEVEQRVELAARLEELAITDPLTELYNRRHFDEVLRREWTRWERYAYRFGLFIIDIDDFKRTNDTHGHQTGDQVLRAVAKVLRNSFRTGDTVARWGGEEFVVVALDVDAKAALSVGERLREAMRNADMPARVGRITVSIGVVSTECPAVSSVEDLIRLADTYLYQAKSAGRDRVVGYTGVPRAAEQRQL